MKTNGNGSLTTSFRNAAIGVLRTIIEERNMKIHMIAAQLVCHICVVFPFNRMEQLALLLVIGVILTAEIVNAALEATVNLATHQYNYFARTAKDALSGAILVFSTLATLMMILILTGYEAFLRESWVVVLGGFIMGAIHAVFAAMLLFKRLPRLHWLMAMLGLVPLVMQLYMGCSSLVFGGLLWSLHMICWCTQWEGIRVEVLDGVPR